MFGQQRTSSGTKMSGMTSLNQTSAGEISIGIKSVSVHQDKWENRVVRKDRERAENTPTPSNIEVFQQRTLPDKLPM